MSRPRIIISRPPIERFKRIALILNQVSAPVTAGNLAAILEVSTKTIYHDIEFMRDRLDLPIESHIGWPAGYTFSKPVQLCPLCQRSHE